MKIGEQTVDDAESVALTNEESRNACASLQHAVRRRRLQGSGARRAYRDDPPRFLHRGQGRDTDILKHLGAGGTGRTLQTIELDNYFM